MSFEILRMMAQEYADRHKEPQSLPATIDTMAYAYQRICQGEDPWTALGDFSNAWYGYAKHIRPNLIKDPLTRPERETERTRHWGAFCAASVEYLCELFQQSCPKWAHDPYYILATLGGICRDHMMRTHKHTFVQLPHQHLHGATSFAVIGSIKINMRCTNGFRKPSSRA